MPGISARGATLTVAAGAAIVGVTQISGPGITLDTVDTTAHDSVDGWEEAVATILRSGEVTLDINYVPTAATHKNAGTGLLAIMLGRTSPVWTLAFTGGSWLFNAFVTGFEPSAPHDGKLSATITLKPTGVVTLP